MGWIHWSYPVCMQVPTWLCLQHGIAYIQVWIVHCNFLYNYFTTYCSFLYQLGPANKPQAKYTPLNNLLSYCTTVSHNFRLTSPLFNTKWRWIWSSRGESRGSRYTYTGKDWMGRTGQCYRPNQTLKRLNVQRRMQSTRHAHVPFMWETKCRFTNHKRTLDRGKLEWNWNRPCEIVQHTSSGTYRLHNQHGKAPQAGFH